MVSVDDIRFELNNPDLDETRVLKTIKRGQDFLRGYCNNDLLFVEDTPELDEALLYLVSKNLNEDVKGRQGLNTENVGGIGFGFSQDIPVHIKRSLNKFTRVRLY